MSSWKKTVLLKADWSVYISLCMKSWYLDRWTHEQISFNTGTISSIKIRQAGSLNRRTLNSDIQFLREQWNIFRTSFGASGLSSWTSTVRWETVRFFSNKMLETTKYAHLFVSLVSAFANGDCSVLPWSVLAFRTSQYVFADSHSINHLVCRTNQSCSWRFDDWSS